jgi:Uncharacterized conserved protein
MLVSAALLVYLVFVAGLWLMAGVVSAAPTPTIASIAPAYAGNTKSISITNLAGANFQSGATVVLTPVNVNPVIKGSLSSGSNYLRVPRSIYVSGNYAYVASSGSLDIIDITNPSSPGLAGTLQGMNEARSISVSGNYAYLANFGSNSLVIVNISNPSAPSLTGILTGLRVPRAVYVSGNYAYVACGLGSPLTIVDVSNPAAPRLVSSIGPDGASDSVYVSGDYAYVTSYRNDALYVINISDPLYPGVTGEINKTVDADINSPGFVYVSGNYAYVANEGDPYLLDIVNITDPAHPVREGGIDGTTDTSLTNLRAVGISGNYAYVASWAGWNRNMGTLSVIDISNPAHPVHKGSLSDTAFYLPTSVFVSGPYAYLSTNSATRPFYIIDTGTIPVTGVTVQSSSQITGTADLTNVATGLYNVVVTNPDGTFGTLAGGFDCVPPPTVTGLSRSSGPLAGGSLITIAGTSFSSTTAVAFGGRPAQNFTILSDTQILAASPAAGSIGTVDVTVTTAGGTSSISTADKFTYTGPVAHFAVSAPGPVTAGTPFNLTVMALDTSGNTDTGYAGTVNFTSSGAYSALPADYTFAAGDNGQHTFSSVRLNTAGSQTITATDTATSAITGTGTIMIEPGVATHLALFAPPSAEAGAPFSLNITALDQYGNTATGYAGIVHFTSTDNAAVLPSDYSFGAGDSGTHTFAAFTLMTNGSQTISAGDIAFSSIFGTSGPIVVNPGTTTHFIVSAPADVTAGVAFSLTVSALDDYRNIATGYTGVIRFASTDSAATLPANATLTDGSGTFTAMLMKTGSTNIIVNDTASPLISGISGTIAVSPVPVSNNGVSHQNTHSSPPGGSDGLGYTGVQPTVQGYQPAQTPVQAATIQKFSSPSAARGTRDAAVSDATQSAIPGQAPSFPVTPVVIGAAVIAIVSAGALIRRWWIRRQNPALFRRYD